jgi:hypothetical protein
MSEAMYTAHSARVRRAGPERPGPQGQEWKR